jgi:4-amino-4-deoxy-L-arabinose transferase-like glycosyltransferase
MILPDWLTSTLAALPALLWVMIGVGLPWALVALPRRDWSDRALVLMLALAFGPTLLTAWMFVLGTLSANVNGPPLLRLDLTLAGTLVMAVVGVTLVWWKGKSPHPDTIRRGNPAWSSGGRTHTLKGTGRPSPTHDVDTEGGSRSAPTALAFGEKLLIGLIAAALVLRFFSIAFWPFMAYDALWVFGYEGRLYTLLGEIPNQIDYYPQFMPLQYTFTQLAVGEVNDHAARAVLLFTHVGSILAVYVLGSCLFNRRVGMIAAALWALYPHVGEWARFGDLEIPVTFLFTASAAFFLMAWTQTAYRRRYALIAGLLFGAAMWTKPTAGAFIWGVLLLLAVELVRVRFDWHRWRPRLEVAVITGLACIPLGAIWYVRNALLGHPIIDFPTGFWLTQAARSGSEFGWPLLGLLALLAYVYFRPADQRPSVRGGLIGLALVLAGLLPSIIVPHRMGVIEWALLAVGVVVLWRIVLPHLKGGLRSGLTDSTVTGVGEGLRPSPTDMRSIMGKLGWALLLALPYFVTWFYSYSYHYRLSFTIVPLMLLPAAVFLSAWLTPERIRPMRGAYRIVLIAIALPGIMSTLYDSNVGWDWLWSGDLTDDFSKYRSGNEALMWVVDGLQKYVDEHPGEKLVVSAPGVERLPFFFPLHDIRVDETPTRWAQLEDVTYFIDSHPEGTGAYGGVPKSENQVFAGLSLATEDPQDIEDGQAILRRAWWKDDGFFRYTVYELHIDRRLRQPSIGAPAPADVRFGDFARYLGFSIGGDTFWPGRRIILTLYWQVTAPADRDYTLYVHLRDANGQPQATWDGPVTRTKDGSYYTTLVWEPGEYIIDQRALVLPNDARIPQGEDYSLVIGFYDPQTGERVPLTIDGQLQDDGYTVRAFRVVAEQP